jgi:hypothetical protein
LYVQCHAHAARQIVTITCSRLSTTTTNRMSPDLDRHLMIPSAVPPEDTPRTESFEDSLFRQVQRGEPKPVPRVRRESQFKRLAKKGARNHVGDRISRL